MMIHCICFPLSPSSPSPSPPFFFSFLHSLFLPLTPPLISLLFFFPLQSPSTSSSLFPLSPHSSPSHSFSVLPSSFRPMDNRLSPPYSTQWLWLCSGRWYALPRWRMQQPVQSELRGLLQPRERRVDHRGSHEHQKKWAGCGRGTCLPILRRIVSVFI